MTHETGNIPRIPSNAPETAKKPRPIAPDGAADRGTRETRAAGAGATGTTGKAPSDGATGRRPSTKAPTAATLNGHGTTDTTGESASDALGPLFPAGDHDRLALRIQHAVSEFVESPRRAVEEAEGAFDTVVEGLTDALEEHRRTLGSVGRDGDPGMRTEELRVTLQHYRDLTERLLNV